LSADGRRIVTLVKDPRSLQQPAEWTARIHDVGSGAVTATKTFKSASIALGAGRLVVVEAGSISVYDDRSFQVVDSLVGLLDPTLSASEQIAFDGAGERIAVADGTATTVWNLPTKSAILTIPNSGNAATPVGIVGTTYVEQTSTGLLRNWRLAGSTAMVEGPWSEDIFDYAVVPKTGEIVVARSNAVRTLVERRRQSTGTVDPLEVKLTGGAFLRPDGKVMAVLGQPAPATTPAVSLVDLDNGSTRTVAIPTGAGLKLLSATYTVDGRYLVVVAASGLTAQGSIEMIDVAAAKVVLSTPIDAVRVKVLPLADGSVMIATGPAESSKLTWLVPGTGSARGR
jgi:hypothetical protein